MVNVFGESVGSGGSVDLQLAKKVVVTVGTFGDYTDEIQLRSWIYTLQTTHK